MSRYKFPQLYILADVLAPDGPGPFVNLVMIINIQEKLS